MLTEPTLAAIAAAATLQETASVTPIPAPTPRIDDLLVQRSEAVVLPSATLRALEPTVRTVAFQPDTGTADPAAGLALLDATRQTESTALLPGDAWRRSEPHVECSGFGLDRWRIHRNLVSKANSSVCVK